ncbi:hypothetical protein JL721_349 [Aureococcus anophagefferens]|nr:hypothetical protein JL721_349 [Aureococcus anophagefferens]
MLSPRIDPSTLVVHARELRTTRAERHRAWCAKADAESRLASLSAECQKLRRRDVARVKALRSTLRLLEIANEGKVAAERAAREHKAAARRAPGGEARRDAPRRRAPPGDGPAPARAEPEYAAAASAPRRPRRTTRRSPGAARSARRRRRRAARRRLRRGRHAGRRAAPLGAADAGVRASSPASVGTYSAYGRDPALHTIDDEGDDEPDEDAFGQVEFGVRAAAPPKPLDATGTLSLEELAGLVI